MKKTIHEVPLPAVQRRVGFGPPLASRFPAGAAEEPVRVFREEPVPVPRELGPATGTPAAAVVAVPTPTPPPPAPQPPAPLEAEQVRELVLRLLAEDPARLLEPAMFEQLVRETAADRPLPQDLPVLIQATLQQQRDRWLTHPEERRAAMRSWLLHRFQGFQAGRYPFPALKPIHFMGQRIFGTGPDHHDVAAARVQVMGAWALGLRHMMQLQNELQRLGVSIDCQELLRTGKLRGVQANGTWFTSKAAIVEYLQGLPGTDPAILTRLTAPPEVASPEEPTAPPTPEAEESPPLRQEILAEPRPEAIPAAGVEGEAGSPDAGAPAPPPATVSASPEVASPPAELPQEAPALPLSPSAWPGLAQEAEAVVRQVLRRKPNGSFLTIGELVPQVRQVYLSKHGEEPTKNSAQIVVVGRIKQLQTQGLLRLDPDHSVPGRAKIWQVIKPEQAEEEAVEETPVTQEPPLAAIGIGVTEEVNAVLEEALAGKPDGAIVTTTEFVPVVQERYLRRYGTIPARSAMVDALAAKLRKREQQGQLRLLEAPQRVGGNKQWVVVRPSVAAKAADSSAAPQSDAPRSDAPLAAAPAPVVPAPAALQSGADPSHVVLPEEARPADGSAAPEATRLAEYEARQLQDQATITDLRQRVAALEQELASVRHRLGLAEFLNQIRESKMRLVVEPG